MSERVSIFEEPRWSELAKLGEELGASRENLRKWRQKQHIPEIWHFDLLQQAAANDVPLTHAELKGRA